MVGMKRAARFTSRMSNERSADELRPPETGAGERSRTVVSALAKPHSAVEPHPRNGVPSRTLTGNLTLRTRPLCVLSYGDEMVRTSGNAPDPGTDLVRCGV